MSFKIEHALINDVIVSVITVEGNLQDPLVAGRIKDEFEEILKAKDFEKYAIVDLSQLKHVDSAFFGKLIAMHSRCEKAGGNFLIVGADDRLKEKVERFGLLEILLVYDDMRSALQFLDFLRGGAN